MYSISFIMYVILFWVFMSRKLAGTDIIAYDCRDPATEITRISLLKVQSCPDPRNATEKVSRRVQLIQERRYNEVHVYSCLITVRQIMTHCGMHSHASVVADGFAHYVHYIRSEKCINAQRYGTLDLQGIGSGIIAGLEPNQTTQVSTILAGQVDTKGTCTGVKYTFRGVSYDGVTVSASILVKLSDYTTVADVESNSVILQSGTSCTYSDKYCFDDIQGETTWEIDGRDRCSTTGIDVLYEGPATILTLNTTSSHTPTKYVVVETQETVFALRLISTEALCHQPAWRTEQNRLLIILETSLGFYYQKSRKIVHNTDMMAQVLSKLLFLEIAVKQQTHDLIFDAILKRCKLREQMLKNRLALAHESPDIVSDLVKEAAGHTGRVVGEVLFVAKCLPKVVVFRRTEYCYQELPVTYQNASMFMTPVTRILQDQGTQVNCDNRLPTMFHLEGKWVEISPDPRFANPLPVELSTDEEVNNLAMIKISPLSSGGIYSKSDMDAFQHSLLFPNERKAVMNLMTRRVAGAEVDAQGYHLPKMFSKREFSTLAMDAAHEVWGFLSRIGNVFSVIAAIYTIWSLLTYFTSVAMNCWDNKTHHTVPEPWAFNNFCKLVALLKSVLLANLVPRPRTGGEQEDHAVDRSHALPPPAYDPEDLERVVINPPTPARAADTNQPPSAAIQLLRRPVLSA